MTLKSSEGRPRPEGTKVAYAPTICDPGEDSCERNCRRGRDRSTIPSSSRDPCCRHRGLQRTDGRRRGGNCKASEVGQSKRPFELLPLDRDACDQFADRGSNLGNVDIPRPCERPARIAATARGLPLRDTSFISPLRFASSIASSVPNMVSSLKGINPSSELPEALEHAERSRETVVPRAARPSTRARDDGRSAMRPHKVGASSATSGNVVRANLRAGQPRVVAQIKAEERQKDAEGTEVEKPEDRKGHWR
jgi:hypothetical protein